MCDDEELSGTVKTRTTVIIPKQTVFLVKCKVNITKPVIGTAIFKPNCSFSEVIEPLEALVELKRNKCFTVNIPIKNSSSKDIKLKANIFVGEIFEVDTIHSTISPVHTVLSTVHPAHTVHSTESSVHTIHSTAN